MHKNMTSLRHEEPQHHCQYEVENEYQAIHNGAAIKLFLLWFVTAPRLKLENVLVLCVVIGPYPD